MQLSINKAVAPSSFNSFFMAEKYFIKKGRKDNVYFLILSWLEFINKNKNKTITIPAK
jgi:hypothetical protein